MPSLSHSPALVLELSLHVEDLVVTMSTAGVSPGPMQSVCRRPYRKARTATLQARIIDIIGQSNRWGDMDRGSLDALRSLGALLFDELLPRPVKDEIRSTVANELQLIVDESLAPLPWELMHDGSSFLGLAFGIGRIIRSSRLVRGTPRRPPEQRWQMLIVSDPRGDLMGSYYEGVTLRDELDTERRRLAVDLRTSTVTIDDLRELIRNYDVLHYAGHAEHHPTDSERSGWVLSDGLLHANAIADLAGGAPFPRLVFANACRSGLVDDGKPKSATAPFQQALVRGLADAMLVAGVQHYVGTLWDVPDEPACHFAVNMYRALLAGDSLGEALRRARHSLIKRYGEDSVLWASYVMYGNAAARYFQRPRHADRVGAARARVAPKLVAGSRCPEPRAPMVRTRGEATGVFAAPTLPVPPGITPKHGLLVGTLLALLVASVTLIIALSGPQAPPSPGWTAGNPVLAAGPHVYPSPMPNSTGPPSPIAPAATVPTDGAFHPKIRLMVQQPGAPLGSPRAREVAKTGASLNSWDHFQVHVRLNRPGFAAVWHIDSAGTLRRVYPEQEHEAVGEIATVAWTELPGPDAWYYLDDARGREMFIVAVSDNDELDEDDLLHALRPLQARLTKLRQSTRRPKGGGLTSRIINDDHTVLAAIIATFSDYFEASSSVEVEHR